MVTSFFEKMSLGMEDILVEPKCCAVTKNESGCWLELCVFGVKEILAFPQFCLLANGKNVLLIAIQKVDGKSKTGVLRVGLLGRTSHK